VLVTFNDLLSRADVSLLQEMLGPKLVRLLWALLPESLDTPRLRSFLLEAQSPHALLASNATRHQLLDLLRPAEALALLQHLGIPHDGNPYERMRQGISARGRQEALLWSFFGLPAPTAPAQVSRPSASVAPAYGLFPHQRDVVHRAKSALLAEPSRLMIHMPTGSGKTRTAMSLAADHLRETEPGLVLWLAATEELCDQAAVEFRHAWSSLGNRELSVHEWWGDRQIPEDAPRDGLVIAGLPKLNARQRNDAPWLARLGDRVSLVIFDEAHQAIAPTYRHLVEVMLARRPFLGVLGLSATPGRSWNDVAADAELARFFAEKKVTLTIPGYANPIDYLIDEGYLARPTFTAIEHVGPNLSEDERQRLADALDIPLNVLERLADDHIRNLHISDAIRRLASRHSRILVFGTTVEHAVMLAVALKAIGIDSRAVTGATPSQDRSRTIAWYKDLSDAPRVLCNYGVLTTGFDAPRTSAVVIARPTTSLVLYSQMVGRAIRGLRAGGNGSAEILTVVDTNLPGFRSLTEAFSNWEDVWTA
jgi:DNA repair protein RadD